MPIEQLEVEHFRCLSKARLEFDGRHNLIIGANAAGKTSILEAIYFLSSGRSFRAAGGEMLVADGHSEFLLRGKIADPFGVPTVFGISGSKRGNQLRMDGRSIRSVSEFARRFPVQVIDPEIHRLLEDGPVRRRRFIDWGVFHVEHSFHDTWRRFNRALKQRNAALRARSATIDVWESDIATHGTVLSNLREAYLNQLRPFVSSLGKQLLNQELDFDFYQGWRRDTQLADSLREGRQRDLLRSSTTSGPHRAELVLMIGGVPARERISRGQQKLLACVLMLSQQLHRIAIGAPTACLLLDDPSAELDVDNLGKLLDVIASLPVQLIVTALSPVGLEFLKNAKLFHVEHGNVKAMA